MEGMEFASWYPALQYLGTQGFFSSYDALPNETLGTPLAEAWISHTGNWIKKGIASPAGNLLAAGRNDGEAVRAGAFARRLGEVLSSYGGSPDKVESIMNKLEINRSEEHTSEIQSLMRISYAVFCLKKKQDIKAP